MDDFFPKMTPCAGIYDAELIEEDDNNQNITLKILYSYNEYLEFKINKWSSTNHSKFLEKFEVIEIVQPKEIISIDFLNYKYKGMTLNSSFYENGLKYFTIKLGKEVKTNQVNEDYIIEKTNIVFLRDVHSISLLKDKNNNSMRLISNVLSQYLMKNNAYFKRCLSRKKTGEKIFEEKLQDARKIIFNQDELVNWLNKIKQDAINETDKIFTAYNACIGKDEKEIDFERAGLLTGVYEKADEYLGIIRAIQPLNINMPSYTILDNLDEEDNRFIESDNIPGYYRIQKNTKIKKHIYEIQNLDEHWNKYLLDDMFEKTEEFGDMKFLLSDYHREFIWTTIKYRPRSKIKLFLDYQLKGFQHDPTIFLNHIEFRILPKLDGFAGNDYPIFELLIKEWLKGKRHHLLPSDEELLLNSVRRALDTFLDDIHENRKRNDENKYNIQIRNYLNFGDKKWYVKDQSLGGETDSESKASKAGVAFRDIIVCNEDRFHISAFECFRMKSIPKNEYVGEVIKEHLSKIFRNEPLGISPLFVIIYYEIETKFTENWSKYLDYIKKINFNKYSMIDLERNFKSKMERANIKIAKATHIRETDEITVYHMIINMHP